MIGAQASLGLDSACAFIGPRECSPGPGHGRLADDPSRSYLRVPYAEKDEAKSLGARWDYEARQWWADPNVIADCPGLRRWLFDGLPMPVRPRSQTHFSRRTYRPEDHPPRITLRTDFSLPDCWCACAPWEDCVHTNPADSSAWSHGWAPMRTTADHPLGT